MKHFSIRNQIIAFYSLLLLAVALFMAAFLFFTADIQLKNVSRASLEQAVKTAANEISYYDGQIEIGPDFDFYAGGVTVLLYGPKGTSLAGTVPSGFPAQTPLTSGQSRTVEGQEGKFLVYDLFITHPEAESLWIRGVYLLDDRIAFFQTMRKLSLLVLPAIFLLAVFGGGLLTRKAFEPVEKICRTAGKSARARSVQTNRSHRGGKGIDQAGTGLEPYDGTAAESI